jgi:transposase-like protein
MSRIFSPEQRARLTQIVSEGISVMEEIEALNEGLGETVKAVAEEMDIKPAVLRKAIRLAQKSRFEDADRDHEELANILQTVGRTA